MKRYILPVLLVCILAFSCKKKEEETVLSASFTGVLDFSIPDYIRPGETYTLTPSGVSTADKSDFGYFWTISSEESVRDTVRHIGDPVEKDGTKIFKAPSEIGDVTITCAAFASGYYNSTCMKTTVVVSAESLDGTEVSSTTGGIVTDSRDSRTYLYNNDGSLDWFCSNLEYAEVGVPYKEAPAVQELFGGFYTYDEAVTACPSGWRLPTVDEWKTLCGGSFEGAAGSLMADAFFNDDRMWEYYPEVKITNENLMSVIPVGYATVSDGVYSFVGFGAYAAFWTSTVYDSEKVDYIYINEKTPDVMVGSGDKSHFAASVRCVK